jgi:hypothetical protein
MKIKLVGAYVLIVVATAIGWNAIEKLSDPFNRALLKVEIEKITNKFKKGQ